MTRLYLVRHGETVWNSEIRIQGHKDILLSEIGRRQARLLRPRIAGLRLDVAHVSDLRRAIETAEIILQGDSVPVRTRPDLREARFGIWEGLTYAEVATRYPETYAARRERPAEVAPPGGETLPEMLRRLQSVLDEIQKDFPDGNVLVVTHGGPLRVLLGALLGLGLDSYWKIRVDNASLSIVDTYPEGAIVSLLNDTCHLAEPPAGGGVP